MTRRSLVFSVLILSLAQIPLFADATNPALAKSGLLENNVMYLRVGEVGKTLAAEIQSAQTTLSATNKIAGTILDLRFADGDDADAAKAAADLFAPKTLPLAILVNDETRGAAENLATDLRTARAGLISG
jgi:C-terminal processing protease CtpA/Prc